MAVRQRRHKQTRSLVPVDPVTKERGPYRRGWPRNQWLEEHHGGESFVAASELLPGALEGIVALYYQKLNSLSTEILMVSETMRQVVSQVASLQEAVSERPVVSLTFLSDLAAKNLQLSRWIPVVLEQHEREAIARWPEVEATGAGATEFEAIQNLRKDIIELYEDLQSSEPDELSSQAAAALALLRSVIEKRE